MGFVQLQTLTEATFLSWCQVIFCCLGIELHWLSLPHVLLGKRPDNPVFLRVIQCVLMMHQGDWCLTV
jgi:hypothetical protein